MHHTKLGPLAARVMQGESIHMVDQPMSINRDGFLEECYHTFSFLPVRNGEGQVVGYEVSCLRGYYQTAVYSLRSCLQNPSTETTPRVIAERRLAVLRDLAQITQLMRTTKGMLFIEVEMALSRLFQHRRQTFSSLLYR